MQPLVYEIFKLKGIIKDITPVELMNGKAPQPGVPTPAVWTAGSNVHFDDESTHRIGGFARFADPLPVGSEPIFQLNVLTPTVTYWIWVDGSTPAVPLIYVTDGVNHFDITPTAGLTGGTVGNWTGTVLNGVPVLNNQIDAPIWWGGATGTPMEDLPGWPATMLCKAIRAFKYHLFALDIDLNGVRVQEQYRWSSAADPGTIPQEWDATPSNDAGSNILAATPGGVVDGLKLRDNFIIYKQHSTYIVSYIAGQYVFSVRSLFATTGIQSLNCVKELRGNHYVFADDDIIRHDGNSFISIADKQVREHLLSGINPDNQHLCHLAIRVPTDEVWVVVPTHDSVRCNLAALYSYTDQVWGMRELPEVAFVADGIIPDEGVDPTWEGATTTWYTDPRRWSDASYSITNDRLLMSDPGGRLLNVDAAHDNDGEPIEAWVERRDWTIYGEDHIWDNDLIRSVYPVITGTPGDTIKIKVAGTRSAGAPVTWGDERSYVIGDQGTIKVDRLTTGRYLNLRVGSSGGNPWELHRIGIEFVPKAKF